MAFPPYEIRDIALLFVEDESHARDLLARVISMNYPGLQLYAADNGAVGLELFRRHNPDIVVTDISMPVMNGIQMAKEIKAIAPEVVIVAVTAHTDASYLLSAIETGIHR